MPTRDPRVDAYIRKASEFARPILTKIRSAVHRGHRHVTETIKWGVPAYVDDQGIVCMTAAFKQHCAWVFWTGRKPSSVDVQALRRITSVRDLPAQATMVSAVREAAARDTTAARKTSARTPARPVKVPAYFTAALRKNSKARAAFAAFPPSHKREYVDWVRSAKTAETRQRRLATAIAWISAGKSRNWKYAR